MVNIDTFRERTFGNVFQSKSTSNKAEEKSPSPIEEPRDEAKLISPTAHHEKQIDESIFSRVNIDTFRERTFDKNNEVKENLDNEFYFSLTNFSSSERSQIE